MEENLQEEISVVFRRLLPLLSSLLFLLISYMPMNYLVVGANVKLMVGFICVYFWLLHRPDLFSLGSICVLGLFEDVLSSAPFGSNLFALLMLYVLVHNLSTFFNAKPFIFIWYGFAMLVFAVLFAKWLLISIYYSQFLPIMPILFSYLFTVAFYPLFSLINAFVQNAFIGDDI